MPRRWFKCGLGDGHWYIDINHSGNMRPISFTIFLPWLTVCFEMQCASWKFCGTQFCNNNAVRGLRSFSYRFLRHDDWDRKVAALRQSIIKDRPQFCPADFLRNRWPESSGMGGRLPQNAHPYAQRRLIASFWSSNCK